MKSREEFEAAFGDEFSGLLVALAGELNRATEPAKLGMLVIQQLRKAKDLRDRIHKFYCPPEPLPAQPTKEQQNGNTNGQQKAQQQRASGNLGGGSSPQARR